MHRVLLVDDDGGLVRQLRRELESEHYTVTTAGDGSSALAQFAHSPPDLVILDWGLRGSLDGLDVLRRIRQHATTPVLMLTARDGLEDKLVGLELGADDYLVKPFARRELLARLKALQRRASIEAAPPAAPPTLTDGLLELDRTALRVRVAQADVALTKGEFALLDLLATHPDRAFHRGFLVERLRGHDYAGTERAIDHMVVRLRRKLGRCGPRLETVFGVGYRWARAPA